MLAVRPTVLVIGAKELPLDALEAVVRLNVGSRELDYRIEKAQCRTADETIEFLSERFSPEELRDVLAFVIADDGQADTHRFTNFGIDRSLEASATELLLTFPEVSWQFVHQPSDVARVSEAIVNHSHGARDWFDPFGVRAKHRSGLLKRLNLSRYVNATDQRAWVLEDEPVYGVLNAYSLYRLGYQVNLFSTREWLRTQLERSQNPAVVLADWELAFPDLRLGHTPDAVGFVAIDEGVSTWLWGPEHSGVDGCFCQQNSLLILTSTSEAQVHSSLTDKGVPKNLLPAVRTKPCGGPWHLSQMFPALLGGTERSVEKKSSTHGATASTTPHATPFGIVRIADRLLKRASQLRAGTSVGDIASEVFIALLAHDAREILVDRTRSLLLSAAAAQLEAEQRMELLSLASSGRESAIRMADRLEKEVSVFPGGEENLHLSLLRTFRRRYSEAGQTAGADLCQRRSAKLELKSADGFMSYLARASVDAITAGGTSVVRLALCALASIAVFAMIYFFQLGPELERVAGRNIWDRASLAFLHSAANFLPFSGGIPAVDDVIKDRLKSTAVAPAPTAHCEAHASAFLSSCSTLDSRAWWYLLVQLLQTVVGFVFVSLLASFAYRYAARNTS